MQKMGKMDISCEGRRLYLRRLKVSDVSKRYVDWINSENINQFLESRFVKHDIISLKNYIKKMTKQPNVIFLAIILKKNSKHIGNIKLGPIDYNHNIADIGIMIGDKSSWGKGYATESINLITNLAFKQLHLHKVTAGAYENNVGSIKAFLNANFIKEGTRHKHLKHKNEYVGQVLMGKINESDFA